ASPAAARSGSVGPDVGLGGGRRVLARRPGRDAEGRVALRRPVLRAAGSGAGEGREVVQRLGQQLGEVIGTVVHGGGQACRWRAGETYERGGDSHVSPVCIREKLLGARGGRGESTAPGKWLRSRVLDQRCRSSGKLHPGGLISAGSASYLPKLFPEMPASPLPRPPRSRDFACAGCAPHGYPASSQAGCCAA